MDKNSGRHDFQINLGIKLLYIAIALDWDGKSKRPTWVRGVAFVPCDCKLCYLCLNGYTTSIAYKVVKNTKVTTVHKCA